MKITEDYIKKHKDFKRVDLIEEAVYWYEYLDEKTCDHLPDIATNVFNNGEEAIYVTFSEFQDSMKIYTIEHLEVFLKIIKNGTNTAK